ncbi:MAG: PAS domain-containing protein [Kordiimonas sp.]
MIADTPNSLATNFELQDIRWPGGRELYEWWDSTRVDKPFPARRDFSPFELTSLLPAIQLIDVGDEERHYSVRLIGTAITEMLGFDPTGKPLDELPGTATVRKAYDWVVDNQKPIMRLNMPIKWADKDFMTFSALVLPLGPEGQEVNMLLLHFHFGKLEEGAGNATG